MRKYFYASLLLNFIGLSLIGYALVKIGSPRYLYQLVQYHGQGIVALKKHRTSLLEQLPVAGTKIVMFGNSITAECEWAELLQNPNVVNRGVIGDCTGDILARLSTVTKPAPKQIFLLIGVNDLLYLPIDSIIKNFGTIIFRIKNEAPQTQLFIESLLPINNNLRRSGTLNSDILILNKSIKAICAQNSISFIDTHTAFCDTQGQLNEKFSLDGIHLNGEGYRLLANLIKEMMNDE